MPIRINLLAEAHAAEEDRRKDPVKRGIIAGAVVVSVVAIWAGVLQFKAMGARSELHGVEAKWKSIEKSYATAVDAQRGSMEAELKLMALHQMSSNRFLWGNVLQAFQQSLGSLDDVQVVRLKAEQSYLMSDGTPVRTNGTKVVQGRAPTATEKVALTIDALDVSANPGRRVNQFKESIATVPYFKESLTKTNGVMLLSRSAPQNSPNGQKTFVMFSLKASFPEKTR